MYAYEVLHGVWCMLMRHLGVNELSDRIRCTQQLCARVRCVCRAAQLDHSHHHPPADHELTAFRLDLGHCR